MDTIVHSDWFPLISGIASILGFVLAVYPIQIYPLQPSEYRTLQWQRTLLGATGIGIIISSSIQIYLKVSPKYEWIRNPSADYAVKYDNCSFTLLAPKTSCDFAITFTPTTTFDERLASTQVRAVQKLTGDSIRSLTVSSILQGKGTLSKPHVNLSIGQELIKIDSPLFLEGDIKDVSSLITKLLGSSNQSTRRISQYIWTKVDTPTKVLLTVDSESTSLQRQSALAQALNNIIQGSLIYELTRFTGVALRPETQSLITQNPTGERLIRLNRLLLEDAYPLEIARSQIVIKLSTDKIDFGTRLNRTTTRPQIIVLTNIGDMAIELDKLSLSGASAFERTAFFIFLNGGGWSILFLLGTIIFILWIVLNPTKIITRRLLLEREQISKVQSKCLREIIGNETYEDLSTHKKNEYNQVMEYFTNLQNMVMDMLTGGFSRDYSRIATMMARKNNRDY